jgi:peptide/nickel transport system substrate-binding protein
MNYVRHPEYFITGKPYFERIEQSIISEEPTIDSQFRSGTLDRVNLSDKGRLEEIQRSVDGVQIEEYSALSMPRVDMAAHAAPFNDLDVRRAISMAFNRDELALATDSIAADWATHAFGAGYLPWYIDPRSTEFGESGKYFQYNAEEAARIISAKAPDGIEVDYFLTPEYLGAVIMAEYLADQLSQIGVKINIVSMTYAEYQNRFRTGPVEGRLPAGMVDERFASRSDPTGWFADYHSPSASRQIVTFKDDELERMMAEQELELDNETRIGLVHEIQRHMADQMWGVPLNSETGVNLTQSRVKNYFHKLDHGYMAEGGISAWLEDA